MPISTGDEKRSGSRTLTLLKEKFRSRYNEARQKPLDFDIQEFLNGKAEALF